MRTDWGGGSVDSGLVFTREDGEPLRPDSISHLFLRLTAQADLPRIRLHDLRHTSASLALAAGVPLKVVSARLGHSSAAITADLYTHVVPVVARAAAEQMAAFSLGVATTPQFLRSSVKFRYPHDRSVPVPA